MIIPGGFLSEVEEEDQWALVNHDSLVKRTMLFQTVITGMWASAQRDGHPAEHRWRPLFNAAKFG